MEEELDEWVSIKLAFLIDGVELMLDRGRCKSLLQVENMTIEDPQSD